MASIFTLINPGFMDMPHEEQVSLVFNIAKSRMTSKAKPKKAKGKKKKGVVLNMDAISGMSMDSMQSLLAKMEKQRGT